MAEHLLKKDGVKVLGTTRCDKWQDHQNLAKCWDAVDVTRLDLADRDGVFAYLSCEQPEIIWHIASMADVRQSFEEPEKVFNNNAALTLDVLEAVRRLKHLVGYSPRIILCSSSEVYGSPSAEWIPISEQCPLRPNNPYAASKLAQDALGQVYFLSYGLDVVRTRLFSCFNARRPTLFATAFALQVLDVKRGKKDVVEHGALFSTRTMLDMEDVVEAYWLAGVKGAAGEAYNIGSDEPVTVGEVLRMLINESRMPGMKTAPKDGLLRPTDVAVQVPDSRKFKKATGWGPKWDLRKSAARFWREVEGRW